MHEETTASGISGQRENAYLVPGSIILAGLLVAGAVLYSKGMPGPTRVGGSPNQAAVAGATPSVDARAIEGDGSRSLGSPDAPVVIVEFSDFECPFCKRFFDETEPQIIEKYVKTGAVRFVYRDFPLSSIHADAEPAARAARCAGEQGKFWQYHNRLFERQESLSPANFGVWAGELGLDAAAFSACLGSGKYAAEVAKDLADGQAAGVTGTPTFFVNGTMLVGALPFAEFETAIERALQQ